MGKAFRAFQTFACMADRVERFRAIDRGLPEDQEKHGLPPNPAVSGSAHNSQTYED
jgi:hypothetical protein